MNRGGGSFHFFSFHIDFRFWSGPHTDLPDTKASAAEDWAVGGLVLVQGELGVDHKGQVILDGHVDRVLQCIDTQRPWILILFSAYCIIKSQQLGLASSGPVSFVFCS